MNTARQVVVKVKRISVSISDERHGGISVLFRIIVA